MEVSGSLQQQHLGDSFSHGWLKQAPSFAADAGCSIGSSRSLDMDDADLFSMRWTTTTPSDFDFGLPPRPGSPTHLACASRIFRRGSLLPSDPVDAAQDHADHVGVVQGAPWTSASSSPLLRSAQSTPVSPSSCSGATSRKATTCVGRRGVSSSWKVVMLRYVRFLMPLYRKARSLAAAPTHKHARVAPAAASPGRGSTGSVDWCHGSADTAVHDAILYCKKSSGQDVLP